MLLSAQIARSPAVSFKQDGALLAASLSLNDNSWWFHEWDAQLDRSQTVHQRSFFEEVAAYVFSPDSCWLAAVIRISENYAIKIWQTRRLLDAQTESPILPDFSRPITDSRSMAFSPDGRWFAYADFQDQKNGVVRLLNTGTYPPIRTLNAHTNPIWDVTFSPDSKLLVSVSGRLGPGVEYQIDHDDNTARVWDVETGDEKFVLQHESSVNSVAFHPDGTFFSTGTENGDINFWDSMTGHHLHKIKAPYGGVNALAFSPDGIWLAASTGSVVQIYRIPPIYPSGEG